MEQRDLAEQLEISTATLRRIESGQRAASRAELERIARVTGTPESFLLHGFGDEAQTSADDDGSLRTELREVVARLERLESNTAGARDAARRARMRELSEVVEEAGRPRDRT